MSSMHSLLYLTSSSSDSELRSKDQSFSTSKNTKTRKYRNKNDDEYLPKKITTEKVRKQYKKWSLQEEQNFLKFLEGFSEHFETKQSRRFHHVFQKMAGTLPTRNAIQCKSHYQYLTKVTNQGNIRLVIDYLKQKNNVTKSVKSQSEIQDEIEHENKIFRGYCKVEEQVKYFDCKESKSLEILLFVNMEIAEYW